MTTVLGQPSLRIRAPGIEAYVTRTGQLGPVMFRRGNRTLAPFSVAPWAEEAGVEAPAMIRALRGDFFCMPFGGNETPFNGERHPPHGDTANLDWTLEDLDEGMIHLSLETRTRAGRVNKRVRLAGDAVLQRHTISGMAGPMTLGHHAMLRFPCEGRVSTSPILGGWVYPGLFERPELGGYSCLKAGAEFEDLARVPMADGGIADLTRYPAREGFEDLVQVTHAPAEFAWNAVVVDGYVWLALKDPRVLPSAVLWHSNGGRHYAPWSGRHRGVLGVEDVLSYFHDGLAESVAAGAFVELDPEGPTEVRYAMALALVPDGFETVARVERVEGGVVALDPSGRSVGLAVDVGFVVG